MCLFRCIKRILHIIHTGILFVLLFLYNLSNAQSPVPDLSFRDELFTRKARHYKQLMLSEQQKTANQEAYDITYYALDLTPDPLASHLTGIAEIAGTITAGSLDRIELNFWQGMSITDIRHSHNPEVQLDHESENDILTIYPDTVYTTGDQFRIRVYYNGRPQHSGYQSFFFDMYNDLPMIWTLSSVFSARAWWPCKDIPSDKPDSMDIKVTVSNNLIVASNGSLRQTIRNGDQTTYWWHEKYPIATYLVSLAIYPYEVHYDEYLYNHGTKSMPIQFYSFPGNYEANLHINNLVKDILAFYSECFGEYPFADEKYGQADFLWSGGMEHQTCTSYGSWNEALYAHEIAHQWWGNMITCESFHHIWLNEGFASYCEALWFENTYPPYTASEYQMMYQLYLGPGTVYVEHPDYEDIFDTGLSYVKGSWILHMLRHIVGDQTFFEILKAYYTSPSNQYGSATTQDFQAVCEAVSGMDLDYFFYQWIYQEYCPTYAYSWKTLYDGSQYRIRLEIHQEQTNYIFKMPIDITITTSAGQQTVVVWDSLAIQSFQLLVSSEPLHVELDKDNWILKRLPESLVDPNFDLGILLVNGVLFDVYGEEIHNSYENHAFWGRFPVTFWDCFNPPLSGYPNALPEPIGYGKVPSEVLGQFSTVIWIGMDYGGDLGSWQQTAILPYLESGGNVLLLTRHGQAYLDSDLQEYLGITWSESPFSTLNNCVAAYPGLQDIAFTGNQSANAVFETGLSSDESTLLFQDTESFGEPRGVGVWRNPGQGGSHRSDGGQFVFLSGRPYRYDTDALRSNVEFILEYIMNESDSRWEREPRGLRVRQNYPNPFNTQTTLSYFLYHPADVTTRIFTPQGAQVRILQRHESRSAGFHQISWDGRNDSGTQVSSGIYFYQIHIGREWETKKMIIVR